MAHGSSSCKRSLSTENSSFSDDAYSGAIEICTDSDEFSSKGTERDVLLVDIGRAADANQNIMKSKDFEGTQTERRIVQEGAESYSVPVNISDLSRISRISSPNILVDAISKYSGLPRSGVFSVVFGCMKQPLSKIAMYLFCVYLGWSFLNEVLYVFIRGLSILINISIKAIVFFVTLDVALKIITGPSV